MEEEAIIKEQTSADASGNSSRPKLQRYALRSSSAKSKELKPSASDCSNTSSELMKRGRSSPSVTRSVGVLDFSGKNRSSSAKPPRRLSIPVKASATPSPKHVVGNTTPTSETTRARRSGNAQGPQTRIQTPVSEIFKSTNRSKFSLICSASYWLSQIKLFESASKHSISLGLFKLALEAGCEPSQKMQEELKSYVHRYQLAELGEPVKVLLQSYNREIEENTEQSQVSESISQVPEEGTRSSDDDVHCSSYSPMPADKLKPKCLDIDSTISTHLTPVPVTTMEPTKTAESTKKESIQKNNTGTSLRESLRTNSANSRLASDSGTRKSVKKIEKPSKPETNKKREVKKHGKNSGVKEVLVSPSRAGDNVPNKENMDAGTTDDVFTEVM